GSCRAKVSPPDRRWHGQSCSSAGRWWHPPLPPAEQRGEIPSSLREGGRDHRRHRRAFRLSGSQVKEAESWNFSLFEQTLVNKLFLQLLNLRAGHLAAIRSDLAVSLGTQGEQLVFRSSHGQRGEQLFLHHGQPPLQILQPYRCCRAQRCRQA